MNHTPPRDMYLPNNPEDSQLSKTDRENIRRAVRTILTRVSDHRDLSVEEVEGVTNLSFTSHGNKQLTLTVYIRESSVEATYLDTEQVQTDTTHAEPHFLRDLGPVYEQFEADLINEMVVMLDLPESTFELKKYTLEFGFTATQKLPGESSDLVCFTMVFTIPDITQKLYDDDEFDIADHIGLPIID